MEHRTNRLYSGLLGPVNQPLGNGPQAARRVSGAECSAEKPLCWWQHSNSFANTIPFPKNYTTQLLCPLRAVLTSRACQPAKHSKIQSVHILKRYRFSFLWLTGVGGEVRKPPYWLRDWHVCHPGSSYLYVRGCYFTTLPRFLMQLRFIIRLSESMVLAFWTLSEIKRLSEATISMHSSSV